MEPKAQATHSSIGEKFHDNQRKEEDQAFQLKFDHSQNHYPKISADQHPPTMTNGVCTVEEIDANPLEKTKLCKFFQQGECPNGSSCSYAHGNSEMKPSNLLSGRAKSKICRYYEQGGCPRGSSCTFAHGSNDVKQFQEMPVMNGSFNIYVKTRMCKFFLEGECPRGLECSYAHGEHELRKSVGPKTKTKLCKFYVDGGCDRGDCSFAHGPHELRPPGGPPLARIKTKMCKFYASGHCPKEDTCTFAHGDYEQQEALMLKKYYSSSDNSPHIHVQTNLQPQYAYSNANILSSPPPMWTHIMQPDTFVSPVVLQSNGSIGTVPNTMISPTVLPNTTIMPPIIPFTSIVQPNGTSPGLVQLDPILTSQNTLLPGSTNPQTPTYATIFAQNHLLFPPNLHGVTGLQHGHISFVSPKPAQVEMKSEKFSSSETQSDSDQVLHSKESADQ